jgi:hypothetical protein
MYPLSILPDLWQLKPLSLTLSPMGRGELLNPPRWGEGSHSLSPFGSAAYGDGVRVGQFGASAPFESAQLIRPSGNAFTTGLSGELDEM